MIVVLGGVGNRPERFPHRSVWVLPIRFLTVRGRAGSQNHRVAAIILSSNGASRPLVTRPQLEGEDEKLKAQSSKKLQIPNIQE